MSLGLSKWSSPLLALVGVDKGVTFLKTGGATFCTWQEKRQ